jgi:hypothetical protein
MHLVVVLCRVCYFSNYARRASPFEQLLPNIRHSGSSHRPGAQTGRFRSLSGLLAQPGSGLLTRG